MQENYAPVLQARPYLAIAVVVLIVKFLNLKFTRKPKPSVLNIYHTIVYE